MSDVSTATNWMLVRAEEDLLRISRGSRGLHVVFVLARPCGQSMYTTERKCFVPSHVLRKILLGGKVTGDLAWCRERIRDEQVSRLKINLKMPLKTWYASRTGCFLPDIVDVRGANICVYNGRLKQKPGCAGGLKRIRTSLLKKAKSALFIQNRKST